MGKFLKTTYYFLIQTKKKPKIQIQLIFFSANTSVIRQKGESQNECFKETKHAKFSEKQLFPTP